MNADWWIGDDDRDELHQGPGPDCPDCGVHEDEPCLVTCMCSFCLKQRDRFGVADPEAV